MLINELKLLLGLASNPLEVDLTQCHCLHWSWYSLYAGTYPDAHWLRDISSLPTAWVKLENKHHCLWSACFDDRSKQLRGSFSYQVFPLFVYQEALGLDAVYY